MNSRKAPKLARFHLVNRRNREHFGTVSNSSATPCKRDLRLQCTHARIKSTRTHQLSLCLHVRDHFKYFVLLRIHAEVLGPGVTYTT